jgi:hypothetical protein
MTESNKLDILKMKEEMENTKNLNNSFTNIKDQIITDLKNENENN